MAFDDITAKAQFAKKSKCNYTKSKDFCSVTDIVKRLKRKATDLEKFKKNPNSDKTCIENIKLDMMTFIFH